MRLAGAFDWLVVVAAVGWPGVVGGGLDLGTGRLAGMAVRLAESVCLRLEGVKSDRDVTLSSTLAVGWHAAPKKNYTN